jgi:hypothetical protein
MKLIYQHFTAVVVVDLWQSLSEWHLLIPACVLVCRRDNIKLELGQETNIKLLVKLGKIGYEIRAMLVQVYADNVMKKTAVYMWAKRFSEGRESVID